MADTKRGRVRKYHREERRQTEREIEVALEHKDEEIDFEELYDDEELDLT
jgi:hypothetical protein